MKEHTIVPRVWNCNDNRDLIQYLRRRHHEKLGGARSSCVQTQEMDFKNLELVIEVEL
jgi:hypothetical protein